MFGLPTPHPSREQAQRIDLMTQEAERLSAEHKALKQEHDALIRRAEDDGSKASARITALEAQVVAVQQQQARAEAKMTSMSAELEVRALTQLAMYHTVV